MKQQIWVHLLSFMIISVLLCGCSSKQNIYADHKSGYKEIEAVPGVTYDVPENALSLATAVTNISEDMEFNLSSVYLYKDGSTQYFLFSMDSMVIAVQKGTHFNFKDAEDKETALKSEKVINIWFDKDEKKYEYDESQKSNYKIISKVKAQVSVTDELYNDFVGELAVIQGNDEWSLFIGAPANSYKELTDIQKKSIEHVASSFRTSDITTDTASDETPVEVTEHSSEDELTTESMSEELTSNIEQQATEENTVSEVPESITESETVLEAETIDSLATKEESSDEVVLTEKEELVEENTKKVESEEEQTINEPVIDKQITSTSGNNRTKETIKLDNQKKVIHDKKIANHSSIYNMLKVGETGIAMTLGNGNHDFKSVSMRLDALYTEQQAIDIIKKGLHPEGITYTEPPVGCTWNVIEYSLDTPLDIAYVNIKLKGFDGEKMKYRGISYSQRTYDIFGLAKNNSDMVTNLYCYYAVPNGCKEYMLECGDGTIETTDIGLNSAYFYINTQK